MLEKIISLSMLAALLCACPALAGNGADTGETSVHETRQEQPQAEADAAQARFPGVRDEVISASGPADVTMHYPVIGNPAADAILADFARSAVKSFEKFLQEDGGKRPDGYASYELVGTYEISRPSETAISVLFSIYSYTGGAHGMRELGCLNFALPSGRRLALEDIFGNPRRALEVLSDFSRARLPAGLGPDYVDDDMLNAGTAPDAANFANLTLLPDAVRVEFEPYQVAPWAAGLPQLTVPLAALAEAEPSRAIWPDAPDGAPGPDAAGKAPHEDGQKNAEEARGN